MRKLTVLAVMALAACGGGSGAPAELAGRWEVQQIAGASLGEGVDVWMEIDAAAGRITGFTGCNNFNAALSGFGQTLSVSAVTEEVGECASPEAATDEARFLGVLPNVKRRIQHGASLELTDTLQGPDALLRLRRVEAAGG